MAKDVRHKNCGWSVNANDDGKFSFEKVHTILLMDIRDELQTLNTLLGCDNFRQIPEILRGIRMNTAKKKKAKGR